MDDLLRKLLAGISSPVEPQRKFGPEDLLMAPKPEAQVQQPPPQLPPKEVDLSQLEDKGYETPDQQAMQRPGAQRAMDWMSGKVKDQPTGLVGKGPAGMFLANQTSPEEEQQEETPTRNPASAALLQQLTSAQQQSGGYKEALGQRDDMLNKVLLSKAANQIGSAIAGGKNSFDEKPFMDMANAIPKDYEKKMEVGNEEQMNDPNSSISIFAREQAKLKLSASGVKNPELLKKIEGMTAKQLESVFGKSTGTSGLISEYQQAMIDVARGKLSNQNRALDQGDTRIGLAKDKTKKTLDTVLSREGQLLGRSIDSMDKTTRNGLGKAAASMMASTELETLINSKPIDQLDTRDMEEVARIVNNMLTGGGTTAASSIEALVPQTFKGRMAEFLEYITNTPQSVDGQDFIKNYAKLAEKQKAKSMTDIGAIIQSRLPEFYRFQAEKPEEFSAIVNAKINALNTMSKAPETMNENKPLLQNNSGKISTIPKNAPEPDPAMDAKINSFMKKNGIKDRNEAINILKENGKI